MTITPPVQKKGRVHAEECAMTETTPGELSVSCTCGLEVREEDKQELIAKFLQRVKKTDTCWLWQGWMHEKGYGRFTYLYKNWSAHRLSYLLFKGEPDPGLDIHHVCSVRSCVNPQHLEEVTHRENVLKSNSSAAVKARRTHCSRGHSFAEANVGNEFVGRKCGECVRISAWRRQQLKKAFVEGKSSIPGEWADEILARFLGLLRNPKLSWEEVEDLRPQTIALTMAARQELTLAHERGRKEGRDDIIKRVEDTIAEFGDQGMDCVAGILQESFHGKREVEY